MDEQVRDRKAKPKTKKQKNQKLRKDSDDEDDRQQPNIVEDENIEQEMFDISNDKDFLKLTEKNLDEYVDQEVDKMWKALQSSIDITQATTKSSTSS